MTRRLTAAVVFLAGAVLAGQARRGAIEVTAVRCWTLAGATRVAIEISGDAHLRSDRIENPDRIFFDLVGARPLIDGRRMFATEVGDKLVKRIRVAETAPDVTRVVLDLEASADYTVSRLTHPNRIVIELRARTAPTGNDAVEAGEHQTDPSRREAEPLRHVADPMKREAEPIRREAEPVRRETEAMRREPAPAHEAPKRTAAATPAAIADPPVVKPDIPKTQIARMNAKPAILPPPVMSIDPPPASTLPASDPAAARSMPGDATAARSVPKTAHAASSGERSLIRALGLKVNRVVIDPGHGGADQGTIGRKGLMEKELVLDVSKRLGKLIEERMASEVIYTRSDDTFIPLQTRTEFANQKKADLFLSIHANSSPHPKIGGIEVYYLNFTRSADALDVAARENAPSEKSVFELRDLIQSITLHDKIEESKEFASKVQGSLQSFESRYNSAAKNRGVKKAPFVVLIGASMPSVLAEVGFLSNAREEMLLKRPDHRQKLAESLYQGLFRYAQSLSHFQVAQRSE